MSPHPPIVNDITRLNPVPVWAVATPTTVAEVQDALRKTTVPVSIGGGHFSMGGQTASAGSLHLDLRCLNQVLLFKPHERLLRVQAGIRWCDIQQFIDPHGFAVAVMQSYANFTVGGSLSVNAHGRHVGRGPLIETVRSIVLVLPDGTLAEASRTQNKQLFYGAIGGYGALGVIVEVELELADNRRLQRIAAKRSLTEYVDYFRRNVRERAVGADRAVLHSADVYWPLCTHVRAVTWYETKRPVTVPYRLRPFRRAVPLQSFLLWLLSETPFGKWRRQYILDPLRYLTRPVHWRNYEAGHDVRELEPPSRKRRTYALQEYFVPAERLLEFVPALADILKRHRVEVLNLSIRHAASDPHTLLAWTRDETFAVCLYHKQRLHEPARERVAVWTRELIDAVLEVGGAYYLPYQPHATPAQFHQAYPRAHELFALKREVDPDYRLRNSLWEKYYAPTLQEQPVPAARPALSEFRNVYAANADAFYRYLQNVYRRYPEDRLHTLIKHACRDADDDATIYRTVQEGLSSVRPWFSALTYALPALRAHKREMTRQTLALLDGRALFVGCVEIGTGGRHVSALRKHVQLQGEIVLVGDGEPGYAPADIAERGGVRKLGRTVPLYDYAPLGADVFADASVDLVTCYGGLHHIAPDSVGPFLESIYRVLRPGGILVVRDHDVASEAAATFVSLAYTVADAGQGVPWEVHSAQRRHFEAIDAWVQKITAVGFIDLGKRLLQPYDPTNNVLLGFEKPLPESEPVMPEAAVSAPAVETVAEAMPQVQEHEITNRWLTEKPLPVSEPVMPDAGVSAPTVETPADALPEVQKHEITNRWLTEGVTLPAATIAEAVEEKTAREETAQEKTAQDNAALEKTAQAEAAQEKAAQEKAAAAAAEPEEPHAVAAEPEQLELSVAPADLTAKDSASELDLEPRSELPASGVAPAQAGAQRLSPPDSAITDRSHWAPASAGATESHPAKAQELGESPAPPEPHKECESPEPSKNAEPAPSSPTESPGKASEPAPDRASAAAGHPIPDFLRPAKSNAKPAKAGERP